MSGERERARWLREQAAALDKGEMFDGGWAAHRAGCHRDANPLVGRDEDAAQAFDGGFCLRNAAIRAGVIAGGRA